MQINLYPYRNGITTHFKIAEMQTQFSIFRQRSNLRLV